MTRPGVAEAQPKEVLTSVEWGHSLAMMLHSVTILLAKGGDKAGNQNRIQGDGLNPSG